MAYLFPKYNLTLLISKWVIYFIIFSQIIVIGWNFYKKKSIKTNTFNFINKKGKESENKNQFDFFKETIKKGDIGIQNNDNEVLNYLIDLNNKNPDNPVIIKEIYSIYQKMGKVDMANKYKEKYDYFLNENIIKNNEFTNIIKINKILVKENKKFNKSTDVTLEISINRDDFKNQILGNKIVLNVMLFDLIDGVKVKRPDELIDEDFPSSPYDWKLYKSGKSENEVIIINSKDTMVKNFQVSKSFYGYSIKLFYDGELQHEINKFKKKNTSKFIRENIPKFNNNIPGPSGILFPSR